jgi:D-glycero-alpha-D-manno-heptose 1-phosphate guanylyltransferase
MNELLDIPAALLVGGLGKRLRSVLPSTPKPLAFLGDKPFLELLVQQLRCQGICNLVMCSGYLADQIETEFGDGKSRGVRIEYSREHLPLGTGGALKVARPFLQHASQFVVMNGDSFLEINIDRLIRFHCQQGGLATVAVLQVQDAGRYGTVQVSSSGRVTRFMEKADTVAPGLINAGVYVFDRQIFEYIPEGPCSLERDIFPSVLVRGVNALEHFGMFIDIGIPEDYGRARALYAQLRVAAVRGGRYEQG